MLNFIHKKEYFEWLDSGIANPKDSTLKGIQDGWVLSILKGKEDLKLAEIGGGKSRVLPALSQCNECWNIDKLEGLGAGPKEASDISGVKLIRSYMGEFDAAIPDNYFDVVFSISVVEHVPKDFLEKFFSDCYRILKPGGIMLHAIDLYVSDFPTENGKIIDTYRETIDSLGFEWFAPPAINGNAAFRCNFASNSDTTMNIWNRIAPSLRTLRETSQSVSIKLFVFKPTGGDDASGVLETILTPSEIASLREPEEHPKVSEPPKLETASQQADKKITNPSQLSLTSHSKQNEEISTQGHSPQGKIFSTAKGILNYYSRWPLAIAALAVASNISAFLLPNQSLRWLFMGSGTLLLLFLTGHAASKADYVLEKFEKAEKNQRQTVSMLRNRVKRLSKLQRRKKNRK